MLKIYNSLGRELQKFEPLEDGKVKMYTCGPTVYDFPSIGNWRTYTISDLVLRTLKYLDYKVEFYMNLTDVGHLTGDNEGDSSLGEDRMEKAEKREGKTAWEIAEFYSQNFIEGFGKMNFVEPEKFLRATDYIQEQIDLVKQIEEKGYTYEIENDGIYFDVQKYEKAGNKYGEISNLDQIKEGARVEINKRKKDPRDFALWKFSPKDKKRHMEWESLWGIGFPGWHAECSAMSMKYLGDQLDIHVGGEDLMSTHHSCEIAQSETVTGKKPFSKYWIHGAFILVDGGRMGKSLGNAYTLEDLERKGFSPMHLKYFYYSGHYRKKINFTWEALESAKNAYDRLIGLLGEWSENITNKIVETRLITSLPEKGELLRRDFITAIEDNFNTPQALAVLWEVTKSNLSPEEKLSLVLDFDQVLGLELSERLNQPQAIEIPEEAQKILDQREKARVNKDWKESDRLRDLLMEEYGLRVKDTEKGQELY